MYCTKQFCQTCVTGRQDVKWGTQNGITMTASSCMSLAANAANLYYAYQITWTASVLVKLATGSLACVCMVDVEPCTPAHAHNKDAALHCSFLVEMLEGKHTDGCHLLVHSCIWWWHTP